MTANCFYCGKQREISRMKRIRVLVTQKVFVCNDKDINDCNPEVKEPDPEQLTFFRCIP